MCMREEESAIFFKALGWAGFPVQKSGVTPAVPLPPGHLNQSREKFAPKINNTYRQCRNEVKIKISFILNRC